MSFKRFAAALIALLMLVPMCASFTAFAADDMISVGKSYTLEYSTDISNTYPEKAYSPESRLTDGKFASGGLDDSAWLELYRGTSVAVTIDLEEVMAVSGATIGEYQYKSAGIVCSRWLEIYVSENGTDFALVGRTDNPNLITDTNKRRVELNVTLDKTYKARYVRVVFSSDIFTFCDEIRIIGSKSVSGNEAKVKPDKQSEPMGYFGSPDGISDIIKLYNGYYQPDDSVGILDEADVLPYIAYIDADGNIAGKMFDAIALVPCHGDYPSGGRLVKTNGKSGAVMSDWELYFEYTFKEGQDLDAIDKTVARVYSELGLKGKYKVFLTLPYPTVLTDKPFGDINGDGSQEYCQTLEERLNIVKWFADKCIDQFKENKYEHIELAGFYWLREEINYSDSDHEAKLVIKVNEYLDKKRLKSIFDPFYLSTGFDHWESLGFDSAVMQPNVAFSNTDYFKLPMLEEFAESAYNNHLGVEIETNEPSYFRGDDYLKAGFNYESYLFYGKKTGYINAFKTYYQGANPGSFYDFCYADTSTPKGIYLRRLYDITYNFIHGIYKNEPPTVSVGDIELVAGDSRVTADIEITDADSYWGDIAIEFVKMPEHGRVTVAASKKTLIFRADEGFVGNDSFVLRVTDGFNYSEELTVNVTVHEKTEVSQSESTPEEDSSNSSPIKDKSASVWLVVLLSLLGLAIVAVAAAAIIKRK